MDIKKLFFSCNEALVLGAIDLRLPDTMIKPYVPERAKVIISTQDTISGH